MKMWLKMAQKNVVPRNWHALEKEEVFRILDTSENGLSEQEVENRLESYGLNKLVIIERHKVLKMFISQFTDFLVLLLIVAGMISLLMGLEEYKTGGDIREIIDAIAIFAIVIINAIIGFVQEYRSNLALGKLKGFIR